MSDAITPITFSHTSFSAVLPAATVGKGFIKQEMWNQTTYPNGSVVTRIYYNTVEVYDHRGVVSKHNQPNQIDIMT